MLNKFGQSTYRVSRLFARYLEGLGITDDEKVFQSFRHSIRRNLRGRAKEEMVDLICGHSDGKVGRRYGRGADMRPLRANGRKWRSNSRAKASEISSPISAWSTPRKRRSASCSRKFGPMSLARTSTRLNSSQ